MLHAKIFVIPHTETTESIESRYRLPFPLNYHGLAAGGGTSKGVKLPSSQKLPDRRTRMVCD
jgi:hypothetical protein